MKTKPTTLDRYRSHPAVESIELESDGCCRYYWINLRPGFATENGRGQSCGSEKTLREVGNFLRDVAPQR